MIWQLPRAPGSYVLEFVSRRRCRLHIGRCGILPLTPAYYNYCGSACGAGGLATRVGRHLRRGKTQRWPIDYLRPWCRVGRVGYCLTVKSCEHSWSKVLSTLADEPVPLPGFGSSDCRCPSHLHFFRQPLTVARLQALRSGQSSTGVVVIMAAEK